MRLILLSLVAAGVCGCNTPTTEEKKAVQSEVAPRHVNGSKPIAFHRAIIRIAPGTEFGHHYAGLFKSTFETFYWSSGTSIGSQEFNLAATEELRNSGFDTLGGENLVFGEDNAAKARFQLGATIKNIVFNIYGRGEKTLAEAKMEVEWQLRDSLTRKIILNQTTWGYAKRERTASGVVALAFRKALARLIAASPLADLVAKDRKDDPPAVIQREILKISNPKQANPRVLPADMEKVIQAVVLVKVGRTLASGCVVSPDGYILTTAHAVSDTGVAVVQFKSGRELIAPVLRVDEAQDIALLKMAGDGHPWLELCLGAPAPVGYEVYAIGAPAGEKLAFSVSKGIVSAYREREADKVRFIQTDASLNPGNSGGPLLDKSGKVVAIVSRKVVMPGYEGLAFGVPLDVVAETLGIVWLDRPQ